MRSPLAVLPAALLAVPATPQAGRRAERPIRLGAPAGSGCRPGRRLGLRAGRLVASLAWAAWAVGPVATAAALPAGSPHVAAPSTLSGTLVQRHGHAVDGRVVLQSWVLRRGAVELRLTDAQPEQLAGQRVTVVDANTARPGVQGPARLATKQVVTATPPPGPQTVLVMVLATPDAAPDLSTARAQQAVFGAAPSASDFYRVESGGDSYLTGRVSSSGDVIAASVSQPVAGCDYAALAAAANQVANAQGWDTSAYDHLIYILPPNHACNFGGLGDMPGTEVWMNDYLGWGAIAHELGHNMGAHHANLLTCRDAGGNVTSYSGDCSSAEYGDPFDVMGVHQAEMGAWHRSQIGMLSPSSTVTLKQSASVALVPTEQFSVGVANLMIPIKTPHQAVTSWYAIDARGASFPYDWWTSGDPVTTGLTVRIVPDLTQHQQTQLIDTTPETSGANDQALQPGETFSDPVHNIAVTAVSGPAGLTADVSMPTLVDDVPPGDPPYVDVSGDTNGVTLSWGPAADDTGVDHYEVYRDGSPTGTTSGQSFSDSSVAALVSVTYSVVAVDASGNKSAGASRSITLPDRTPPGAMGTLVAQVGPGSSVLLRWPAGSDNRGVSQYELQRDGRPVTYTSGLSYTDSPGIGSHHFTVMAVDAAGNAGQASATDVVVPATGASGSTSGGGTGTPKSAGGGSGGGSVSSTGGASPVLAGSRGAASSSAQGATFRLLSYHSVIRRGRREYFATFSSPGSSSIFATINGRPVGRAGRGRLTVRFTVSRHHQRTVVIHATFSDGTAIDRWTFSG